MGFSDTMHRLAVVSDVSIQFARVPDYIGPDDFFYKLLIRRNARAPGKLVSPNNVPLSERDIGVEIPGPPLSVSNYEIASIRGHDSKGTLIHSYSGRTIVAISHHHRDTAVPRQGR